MTKALKKYYNIMIPLYSVCSDDNSSPSMGAEILAQLSWTFITLLVNNACSTSFYNKTPSSHEYIEPQLYFCILSATFFSGLIFNL